MLLSILLVPALVQASASQLQPRGEFVLLKRGDTLRVERFAHQRRVFRSEITRHTGERDEITAWLNSKGVVDSMMIVEVDRDSRFVIHTAFGERTITSRTVADGTVEESGPTRTPARVRAAYVGSIAVLQLLLPELRLTTGQSKTLSLGSHAEDVRPYNFTRAGDTLVVIDEEDPSWLALDPSGTIVGGRTREADRVVRRTRSLGSGSRTLPGATGWVKVEHPWLVAARELGVDSLPGAPRLYYSKGYGELAVRLGGRVAEATRFFQDSLAASSPLSLLVLEKEPWAKTFGPRFWGFASNSGAAGGAEWAIIQPATGDGPLAELIGSARSRVRVDHWRQLDSTEMSTEALALRHMDMVVAHEYGHVLVRSGAIPIRYGQTWFQEFLATYLMYAFLVSRHPELATMYDAWDRVVLESATDPIADVTRYNNPMSVTADQLLWFYAATGNRVRACYRRHGLNLIRDLSKSLNRREGWSMPQTKLVPTLEAACQGFARWTEDMRSDRVP